MDCRDEKHKSQRASVGGRGPRGAIPGKYGGGLDGLPLLGGSHVAGVVFAFLITHCHLLRAVSWVSMWGSTSEGGLLGASTVQPSLPQDPRGPGNKLS